MGVKLSETSDRMFVPWPWTSRVNSCPPTFSVCSVDSRKLSKFHSKLRCSLCQQLPSQLNEDLVLFISLYLFSLGCFTHIVLLTDYDWCGGKPGRGAKSWVLLPTLGSGGCLSLLLLQSKFLFFNISSKIFFALHL